MAPYSRGLWQEDEHQRFLEALKRYPRGPWAEIAHFVGTRSARQVQTHAQKYYEKIERHVRGLQRDRRGGVRLQSTAGGSERAMSRTSSTGGLTREHEIDEEILAACSRALELGERLPTPARPRKADRSDSTRHQHHANTQNADEEQEGDDGRRGDTEELEEEEEEEEEETMDDLLPLDKSLDFLIELLAGLDDPHSTTYANWASGGAAIEIQAEARYA